MKLFVTTAFLFAAAAPALAQTIVDATEPTERGGISIEVLEQNALAAQIPAFDGYDMRARRITFVPGATLTKHNHAERPGLVIVESGTIIESRGPHAHAYTVGESWIEDADTDHWLRNDSNEDAVIIMIDLPPSE